MKIKLKKQTIAEKIYKCKGRLFLFIEEISFFIIIPSSVFYFYSFSALSELQINYLLCITPIIFVLLLILHIIIFNILFNPVYICLKPVVKNQTINPLIGVRIKGVVLSLPCAYSLLIIARWSICFIFLSTSLHAGPGISVNQLCCLFMAAGYGMTFSIIIASILIKSIFNETTNADILRWIDENKNSSNIETKIIIFKSGEQNETV